METTSNPSFMTTSFESGIKKNEYQFQWHIKDLELAFKTGGLEPCAPLISEISMEFTTADRIVYPESWRFSLDYDQRKDYLLLKALPRKLSFGSGSSSFSYIPQTNSPSIYAVIEVEHCGQFTLLNEQTQTPIINVQDVDHYLTTVEDEVDDPQTLSSLTQPQSTTTTFASQTIPQFGRGFGSPAASPVLSEARKIYFQIQPLKSASGPILLPLFHCNDAFRTALRSSKGCLTLTIKIILLQTYRKSTERYGSEQSIEQNDAQQEDISKGTSAVNNKNDRETGRKLSSDPSKVVDVSVSSDDRASKSKEGLKRNRVSEVVKVAVAVDEVDKQLDPKKPRVEDKQDVGSNKTSGSSAGSNIDTNSFLFTTGPAELLQGFMEEAFKRKEYNENKKQQGK